MKRYEMERTPTKAIAAFLAVTGIVALALAGCSGSNQTDSSVQPTNQAPQKPGQTVRYTCPMHPDVLQDKPGDCPKCGMKLVEQS